MPGRFTAPPNWPAPPTIPGQAPAPALESSTPPPSAGSSGAGKLAWHRRRWVQLAAVFLLGLVLGGMSSSSSVDEAQEALRATENRLQVAETRTAEAEAVAAEAKKDAEEAAREASADAAAVEAELAAQKAELDARAAELEARSGQLDEREAAIAAQSRSATSPPPQRDDAAAPPASVSYANCDAVRAAGAAPIRPGDPGWSSKFDRDGDGVGCE